MKTSSAVHLRPLYINKAIYLEKEKKWRESKTKNLCKSKMRSRENPWLLQAFLFLLWLLWNLTAFPRFDIVRKLSNYFPSILPTAFSGKLPKQMFKKVKKDFLRITWTHILLKRNYIFLILPVYKQDATRYIILE